MEVSLNKCQIIGYMGADPEMRFTASGTAMTIFSVGVSNSWKGQDGERREETEWFRCVAWNQLAEVVAQNLTKGRQVYVEGRMQTRSWDQDGVKRYSTELIASQVQFLGPRPEGAGVGAGQASDYEEEDDIPFDN